MKLAVTYDEWNVSKQFLNVPSFKFYDIEEGTAAGADVVKPDGGLVPFLIANGVEALICGGISCGARGIVESNGIRLYSGVSGRADDAAQALAKGELVYSKISGCRFGLGDPDINKR